ncbi:hypothetical protein VIGAN_09229800 [Vigna angularis var. angularis]|uniref:WRKY domain-containing protein n=1 Tax=Vigna angularis var. angularis TaxID=157739 RepID=A0A0S3T0A9_PHAAN|nr:hypothetical protein VIGAN_09229800 [Vigna angularis var. angularis]
MGRTQMRKIDAFEEYGVRGTYQVQEAENKLNVPNVAKEQPHDETKGHEPDVTSKREVQILDDTQSNGRAILDGEVIKRTGSKRKSYSEISMKPKISSVYVRTKASETTLVQRRLDDQSVLVATYEGEHNHPQASSQMEATSGSGRSVTLASVPCAAATPTLITLDLTKSKSSNDSKSTKTKVDTPKVQQVLVEQMATSLTTDPNFRAALVAAISGRLLHI